MLVITSDEDLNPVLVLAPPEHRRRLASDVLAPEEELRKGPLCVEQGVFVA